MEVSGFKPNRVSYKKTGKRIIVECIRMILFSSAAMMDQLVD